MEPNGPTTTHMGNRFGVNAAAEVPMMNTKPIESVPFSIPEAGQTILRISFDYVKGYVQKRITFFIASRLAQAAYARLTPEQQELVDNKKRYVEETVETVKQMVKEKFAESGLDTESYVPEVLILIAHSIQHGFDVINGEIDAQLMKVQKLGVYATGKILNFLFTSDLTIRQVGWRPGAPMSARVLERYQEYWNQATGVPSNLITGLAYSQAIEDIHPLKSTREKSELLYKMTHPEEFGADANQIPQRHTRPYLLLSPEDIQTILKITLVGRQNRGGERNYEGTEEVFTNFARYPLETTLRTAGVREEEFQRAKRLFFGIREKGGIHFFYKFDPGFLHHGVILTGGLCVEVQNRIFKPSQETSKRVRAVVTPSSILDLFQRAKAVGLYAFSYTNGFDKDVIQRRALWTIGKWDYDLFYNNCEHHTTWVFGNKLASEQCQRMEMAVTTLGAQDPRIQNIRTEDQPAWRQELELPPFIPGPVSNAARQRALNAVRRLQREEDLEEPELPPFQEAIASQVRTPGYLQPTVSSQIRALPQGLRDVNMLRVIERRGRGGGKQRRTRRRTP